MHEAPANARINQIMLELDEILNIVPYRCQNPPEQFHNFLMHNQGYFGHFTHYV